MVAYRLVMGVCIALYSLTIGVISAGAGLALHRVLGWADAGGVAAPAAIAVAVIISGTGGWKGDVIDDKLGFSRTMKRTFAA